MQAGSRAARPRRCRARGPTRPAPSRRRSGTRGSPCRASGIQLTRGSCRPRGPCRPRPPSAATRARGVPTAARRATGPTATVVSGAGSSGCRSSAGPSAMKPTAIPAPCATSTWWRGVGGAATASLHARGGRLDRDRCEHRRRQRSRHSRAPGLDLDPRDLGDIVGPGRAHAHIGHARDSSESGSAPARRRRRVTTSSGSFSAGPPARRPKTKIAPSTISAMPIVVPPASATSLTMISAAPSGGPSAQTQVVNRRPYRAP